MAVVSFQAITEEGMVSGLCSRGEFLPLGIAGLSFSAPSNCQTRSNASVGKNRGLALLSPPV